VHQLIQAELNIMKLNPGLGASYAIQIENRSGLFYSFWGLHGALTDEL